MKILIFKTNITSPIGLQAIWEALKSLGINQFFIDFYDVNNILKVVSDKVIAIESVVNTLTNLGYNCEELR